MLSEQTSSYKLINAKERSSKTGIQEYYIATGLQCGSYHSCVTYTFKSVICPSTCEMLNNLKQSKLITTIQPFLNCLNIYLRKAGSLNSCFFFMINIQCEGSDLSQGLTITCWTGSLLSFGLINSVIPKAFAAPIRASLSTERYMATHTREIVWEEKKKIAIYIFLLFQD